MINTKQKMLLHVYADAAGLPKPEYRRILKYHSGCVSSADSAFTQDCFEVVMAALESILFDRVDTGRVVSPIGRSRWIRSRDYWRKRLPATGRINSRQFHRIEQLWTDLMPHMPEDQRSYDYLARIVRKSTGKTDVGLTSLTTAQASHLIDALTDRLTHALSHPSVAPLCERSRDVPQHKEIPA